MRHHGYKHVGLDMMKRHCKQYAMNMKSKMGRQFHGLHMGLHSKFGHGHGPHAFQHHGKFHHGHGREHLWGRRGPGPFQSGCFHMGWGPFMQTPTHRPTPQPQCESPPCNSCGPPSYGFCVPPPADADGQKDDCQCQGRCRRRRGHPCHRPATSGDEGGPSRRDNIPDDGQRGGTGGGCKRRRGHPCRSGDDSDSGRENLPEDGQRRGRRRGNPCRRIPPRQQGWCPCGRDNVPERAHSAPPAGFTSGNEDAPGPSGIGGQTSRGCCMTGCGN